MLTMGDRSINCEQLESGLCDIGSGLLLLIK